MNFSLRTLNLENIESSYVFILEDLSLKKHIIDTFRKIIFHDIDCPTDDFFFREKEVPVSFVVNHCLSEPLFASQKIIFLDSSGDFFQKEVFLNYLKNPSQKTCLIVFLSDRRCVTQELKKKIRVVSFSKKHLSQSDEFFSNILKEHDVFIAQNARSFLLKSFADQREKLSQEMEKMCLFVGEKGLITMDICREFVSFDSKTNIFEFLYLFFQSNYSFFVTRFYKVLRCGNSSYEIFGLLFWFVRRLWSIHEMIKKKYTFLQISQQLKTSGFAIKKMSSLAKRINEKSFTLLFTCLYEFNVKLKMDSKGHDFLIENLFFEFQSALSSS